MVSPSSLLYSSSLDELSDRAKLHETSHHCTLELAEESEYFKPDQHLMSVWDSRLYQPEAKSTKFILKF